RRSGGGRLAGARRGGGKGRGADAARPGQRQGAWPRHRARRRRRGGHPRGGPGRRERQGTHRGQGRGEGDRGEGPAGECRREGGPVTGAGRRARTTRRHLLAAGLAGVVSTACGYSLAGRGNFLPSYIRIIGIPQFTNNTTVFDLERTITERVRTEFIGRGRYQVVPDTEGVDAVLNGTIVGVTLEPTGFNQNNQATRYLFRMTLMLEFKDVKADKVIWGNPAQQF